MDYKIILNKKIWGFIIICISISSVFIRYTILPNSFFFDSPGILSLEKQISVLGANEQGSFIFVAMIFHYINFFNIDNLLSWSIYISVIFFVVNFFLLKDIYIIDINRWLFILLILFIWYLFAAGISKEVIQTIFYLFIYLFIVNDKILKSIHNKIIMCIFILIIESIYFREYYILVAFFSGVLYLISIFLKRRHFIGIKYYILHIIYFLCILFIFLLLVAVILPNEYEVIINLRTLGYNYLIEGGTDSFISNIIEGDSIYIYMLNYIINYFRLLFPIELLFIGKIYYLPYIVYQVIFTYFYISNLCNMNKINKKKFISVIFLSSFIFVSVMMEPDFGSWIRHQTACYMLIIILLKEEEYCKNL